MPIILIMLLGSTLTAAEPFASLDAEATRLGLPSTEGTWWTGNLPLPGEALSLLGRRGPHVRRADGIWLVDLVVPIPENQLDPDVVALLAPLPGPVLGEAAGAWGDYHQTAKLLRLAAGGVIGAAERCAWLTMQGPAPPTPIADDLAGRLRWALYRAMREAPDLRAAAAGMLPPAARTRAILDAAESQTHEPDDGTIEVISPPAEIDSLVEAWLADPTTDDARLAQALPPQPGGVRPGQNSVLTWWITRPNAARWARLVSLLNDDPSRPAALRLRAALAWLWDDRGRLEPAASRSCWQALCWLALGDLRELPPVLQPAMGQDDPLFPTQGRIWFGPLPDGLRCADLVADQLLHSGTMVTALAWTNPKLAAWSPYADVAVRDLAIAILRDAIAADALAELVAIGVEPPPGLGPAPTPGLTTEETAHCRQALAEARTLGFPDLTGAEARYGTLVDQHGRSELGVHLRLADGSWLRLCDEPVLASTVVTAPTEPIETDGLTSNMSTWRRIQQMPVSAQVRIHQGPAGYYGAWPAVAQWLSGTDRDGLSVASSILILASDVPGSEKQMLPAGGGGANAIRPVPLSVPDMADGMRRLLSAWFRNRLVAATNRAEAERWHAAAVGMLAASDREAWQPALDRLRDRIDLKPTAPAQADLATRLASWDGGKRTLPVVATDTNALLAMCGDLRASRWLDDGWARTIGDNALRALGWLHGVDVRWLTTPGEEDQYQWNGGGWDDTERTRVGAALATWRSEHPAEHLTVAVLRAMPTGAWDGVWHRLPEPPPAELGAVIAERMPGLPQVLRERSARHLLLGCLRFPNHPAINAAVAALPPSHWRTRLAALRAAFSGRPQAFDELLAAALDDGHPPSADFRNPLTILHPLNNLGLWAHDPTSARLERLRTALAAPLDRDGTIFLIAQLGFGRMKVLESWPETDRFTKGRDASDGIYAIPAALLLASLDDQRLVPADRLDRLKQWTPYDRQNAPMMPNMRVCDWAAAQAMVGHERLGLHRLPPEAEDRAGFLVGDVTTRNPAIAALRAAFVPVVGHLLIEAGLAPAPPVEPSPF